MSRWEEHTVNNWLIFAFRCWNKQLFTLEVLFHDELTLHKFAEEDLIAVIVDLARHKPTAGSSTMLKISEAHASTATQEITDVAEESVCTFATSFNEM